MLIDPRELRDNLERLEEIEKSSLRFVVQAIYDYREFALEIFREENDLVADIGEDITREALEHLGMSKINQRQNISCRYRCFPFKQEDRRELNAYCRMQKEDASRGIKPT